MRGYPGTPALAYIFYKVRRGGCGWAGRRPAPCALMRCLCRRLAWPGSPACVETLSAPRCLFGKRHCLSRFIALPVTLHVPQDGLPSTTPLSNHECNPPLNLYTCYGYPYLTWSATPAPLLLQLPTSINAAWLSVATCLGLLIIPAAHGVSPDRLVAPAALLAVAITIGAWRRPAAGGAHAAAGAARRSGGHTCHRPVMNR